MTSPDPISLVALIVSLVALILTLLQVAQQYVGTASEYRHCSERTLGGWHRKCRRRFIWSELRFEVHFATPTIKIGVISSQSTNPDHYAVPSTEGTTPDSSAAQYILHTSEGDITHTSSEKPWFLDVNGTRPEAKCTWLTLLNDAAITHLQIGIDEHTFSYDFMPNGIKKPLARMDRKSFLTLMSLFQVSWQEGWGGEVEKKGGGKRETPSGAGPYCEITSRNLVNFGTVISYRQLPNPQLAYRFYIFSEKARSAMFNRFDLGFHVALTHTSDEVYSTVLALTDQRTAATVHSFYRGNNGYAPGLAEAIACFAEPEMPKAIEYGTDKFLSIFSARSLGSIFNDHLVDRLLGGDSGIPNSNSAARKFAEWAKNYVSPSSSNNDNTLMLPADQKQIQAALEMISSYSSTEAQKRRPISWSDSRKCLRLIKLLDTQLTTLCNLIAPNHSEVDVHRDFAKLQIGLGCTIYTDAVAKAEPVKGFWRDFKAPVFAENYEKVCAGMWEKYPKSEEKIQNYVINRLMRGSLWSFHNGNCATNQKHDERMLECSLNSHWLSDTSSLWIE